MALFEAGHGRKAVAARLGVSATAVQRLRDRWTLRSAGALMNKPDRRSFAFEFKLGVVARYVGGEATALELARDHGLRPRRKGRPPAAAAERSGPGELERLWRRTCGCRRRWPAWKNCGP